MKCVFEIVFLDLLFKRKTAIKRRHGVALGTSAGRPARHGQPDWLRRQRRGGRDSDAILLFSSMTAEACMNLARWCCRPWLTAVARLDAEVGCATARLQRDAVATVAVPRLGRGAGGARPRKGPVAIWSSADGGRSGAGEADTTSNTSVDGDMTGVAASEFGPDRLRCARG
jgi:hypothetical protein